MKILMAMWVCMLMAASSPVQAEDCSGRCRNWDDKVDVPASPNPRGKALGHQNVANPHYVAPVSEEGPTFDVCPYLQSAPHMCVNFDL